MTTVEDTPAPETEAAAAHTPQGGLVALMIGALGIVYGDLGTSPLYAIREAFESSQHRLPVDRVNVLGAVSIVVWTLIIIIAVKYVALVLRADNHGEGGILSLTALVAPEGRGRRLRTPLLVLLGLFGTALLFGDGMITPAISVLSAVEGLDVVQPGLERAVVPIAVAILVGLFAIQRFGSASVGRVFGPVMVVWFVTMAMLGATNLARAPEIVQAVNPTHAVEYFTTNTWKGFLSMGSLFLVVTGGEALYADLAHFGRRPIRLGWYAVVMPSLLLTYFGMGALLLQEPEAISSPFFLLAPDALQLPLVILATVATIIASQALISGVFSLTAQAVQLGYAPLTRVIHTSPHARGQIYVPLINWALMIACVGLVIGFGSSGRLAAAFGLSVTGTMFITTILFAVYARRHWRWNPVLLGALIALILVVEGAFLAANVFKIPQGGWVPLVVGVVVLTLFTTWKTGRSLVAARNLTRRQPLQEFVAESIEPCRATGRDGEPRVVRTPGTAVFLHSQRGATPPPMEALVHSTHALHEIVYVTSIATAAVPRVADAQRVETSEVGCGVHAVTINYGFVERTTVAADLDEHLDLNPDETDFFIGRDAVRPSERPGMARWREVLFGSMTRNATDVAQYFHLPDARTIEIGVRVDI